MSIKKSVTPESVAKRADDADMGVLDYVIRDYDNAILDPNVNRTLSDMGLGKTTREERIRFAKEVFDEQAGVGGKVTIKKDPLVEEAKKYKSAEEFVADVNQTNISRLKQDQNFSFDVDAADFNQWLWKGVPRSGRKYELVYMSPDEYLNLLRTKSDIGDVPAFPNKDIANLMRGGEKMPVPWLEYDKAGKIIGQEGRNRALAAKELGIKEIPVVSEMPTSATSQLTDIWNKANKADPLVEEARKYKSAEEYIKSKKSKDFWKKRNEEKAKRKLPTKSNNLYHTTPAENLDSIIKDGLVIGKKPRFEGVSSSKKISLSANEDAANYYGGNSDIMIRTKTGYIPQNLESDLLAGGDGVYTTTKNIPPNMLQVKVGGKWYDLTDKQLTDIWKKANRKGGVTEK